MQSVLDPQQQRIGERRKREQHHRDGSISSACSSCMALMIRKPSPCLAANISASSTPSSVKVKPMRSPTTISGSVAGNSTVSDGLPRRQVQRARRFQIDRRNIADRVHGQKRNRQHAVHGAERHPPRQAQPEDQQHHRIERDLRQRVERDEDRLADRAGQAVNSHPHPDRKPDPVGQEQRAEERHERRPGVLGKALASARTWRDRRASAAEPGSAVAPTS